MKLTHRTIPQEFLSDIPRGMKYVVRNGQDFLVVEQVFCLNGHSLMVDNVRLHSEPSISITLRVGHTEGLIYLDSFWGSHDKLYNFVPDLTAVDSEENDVMCPACGCSLVVKGAPPCKTCGSSKVFAMYLPGSQNQILACSKIGCPGHRIVVEEISDQFTSMVDDINYFGF